MHLQIRSRPAKSPADLAEFLAVLERHGINMLAAGGGDLEGRGEFAFAVEHDTEEEVKRILEREGYKARIVRVRECWMEDKAGELLRCIREATLENQETGRKVKDIAIGGPRDGMIPVQIYSESAEVAQEAS
jgi:hypothetical protein